MFLDRQVNFVPAPSAAIKRTHRILPMNISVFARGSNPAVDRHIQRKSESFCAIEVNAGRADWVNPDDHSRGIICRDFLYFGEKVSPAQPEQLSKLTLRNALPPIEVRGGLDSSRTQYNDPTKSLVTREARSCLLVRARAFARYCDLEYLAQA